MKTFRVLIIAAAALLVIGLAVKRAEAQPINITGNLLNSCILSIATNGTMTASANGQTISSENSGGTAGSFTLVAIGLTPTVQFSAPTLEKPAGAPGTPAAMIRYTSLRGATQSWTGAASSVTAGALLDTFSVHGRVDNDAGFASGQYRIQTVVTCQQ